MSAISRVMVEIKVAMVMVQVIVLMVEIVCGGDGSEGDVDGRGDCIDDGDSGGGGGSERFGGACGSK